MGFRLVKQKAAAPTQQIIWCSTCGNASLSSTCSYCANWWRHNLPAPNVITSPNTFKFYPTTTTSDWTIQALGSCHAE